MTTGKDRYAEKYHFAVTRVSGASGCGELLARLDEPRDPTRNVKRWFRPSAIPRIEPPASHRALMVCKDFASASSGRPRDYGTAPAHGCHNTDRAQRKRAWFRNRRCGWIECVRDCSDNRGIELCVDEEVELRPRIKRESIQFETERTVGDCRTSHYKRECPAAEKVV